MGYMNVTMDQWINLDVTILEWFLLALLDDIFKLSKWSIGLLRSYERDLYVFSKFWFYI